MKAISFLGIANYSETTYNWQGQKYTTHFFPVALAKFTSPQKLLVCVTPTVEKHENIKKLGDELNSLNITWETIPIPEGHNEQDLWKIFDALTEAVEEEEELIFDVTYSFRSLPILAFLAIAYLKSAKKVQVKQVLYGAYEARNTDNLSPVFDLTPFVTLLDWLTATEQFVQTGNARFLSELINPRSLHSEVLSEASNTLQTISQAARLCQPFTLMQEVKKLDPALTAAQRELQVNARPFGVLRDQIVQAFAQFHDDGKDVVHQLQTEYCLIEWYYQKGQFIQAVTLGREWLIDVITYRLDEPLDFLSDKRKPFEEAISGIALLGKDHPQDRDRKFTKNDLNRFGITLLQWEEHDMLKQLWTDLKNIRNALDHAEHQRKKEKEKTLDALQKLQAKMDQEVMPTLRNLAKKWGFA